MREIHVNIFWGGLKIVSVNIGLLLESYFRIDATVCVLSTITGLDGGTNFGGCSMLSPAARCHTDVDRNPEDEK